MTDAEKIEKIVAFVGGWPEHKYVQFSPEVVICGRCGDLLDAPELCSEFNPFTRIEDAMMVVERLSAGRDFTFFYEHQKWIATIRTTKFDWKNGSGDTPARAITEAAWQVIEKLSQT